MIYLDLYHELWIQINTDNNDYLKGLRKEFSHLVSNYQFMPRFKSGTWDGKICLMNAANNTIPFGLFTNLYKFTKENYPDEDLTITDDIKKLFKNENIEIKYDLNLQPYDYQSIAIEKMLSFNKSIVRMVTGSGKSLIISYVCKNLYDNGKVKQQLIIVPTVSLVQQFRSDMIEYGIDSEWLGMVDKDHKEFDKKIVISTWQSLQHKKEELNRFQTVVCDECHKVKASVLFDILKHCPSKYRFACTGTMPNNDLEFLQVQSFLGPVIYDVGAKELSDQGYLSECKINRVILKYNSKITGDYNKVKETIFNNPWRINIIRELIGKCEGTTLLLVSKVELEGETLLHKLRIFPELENKQIVFLSGRDDAEDREKWRKKMDTDKDIIMIATYPIFSTGINIKSLKNLIFASPMKSFIVVMQSIGRTLRKCESKNHAVIYDICDECKYLKSHSKSRLKYYIKEQFETIDIEVSEGNSV